MSRRERTEKVIAFLLVYLGVFAFPWLSPYLSGVFVICGALLFILSGFASDP